MDWLSSKAEFVALNHLAFQLEVSSSRFPRLNLIAVFQIKLYCLLQRQIFYLNLVFQNIFRETTTSAQSMNLFWKTIVFYSTAIRSALKLDGFISLLYYFFRKESQKRIFSNKKNFWCREPRMSSGTVRSANPMKGNLLKLMDEIRHVEIKRVTEKLPPDDQCDNIRCTDEW